VRALLGLMREHEDAVRDMSGVCQVVLGNAISQTSPSGSWPLGSSTGSTSESLKILDPEVGDQELIKSVEAELAKLRIWACER